jgi:hypothetical protein
VLSIKKIRKNCVLNSRPNTAEATDVTHDSARQSKELFRCYQAEGYTMGQTAL